MAPRQRRERMRALVTGGAGFIGHHLVRSLLHGGIYDVTVIDNFSTGWRERLLPYERELRLIEGDIRDSDALDQATQRCDVIFHEAALPSVARSVSDPRLSNDVNTNGTIEVMLAAARAGVHRVIFAGSSSVYGDSPTLPRHETQLPAPRSPYATSKLAGEFYVHSLGTLRGVESVVLRYFNVFGPGQDPNSQYSAVIPKWITAALRNDSPIVHGDGTQSRDFTFIDNIVSANLLAANVPDVSGLTCNIGSGHHHSLLTVLTEIGRLTGQTLKPTFAPIRPGDVPHSHADISVAEERLGYRVLIPFADGILQTIESYRNNYNTNGTATRRSH